MAWGTAVPSLDFALSEEDELFRRSVEQFVQREVAPQATSIDASDAFPTALFRRLGELGYFGIRYPKHYGGVDGSTLQFNLMMEELAKGSLSVAASCAMQCLMGTDFLHRHGSAAMHGALLVPAIKGEKVGAFALSEPSAGSDLAAIGTTATLKDDRWVLSGQKMWVTNGDHADFFTVGAMTDRSHGLKGIDFFLVERDTPGLVVGAHIEKLGLRGSDTTELALNHVQIPRENLLGGPRTGFDNLHAILAQIRTMTGALSVGLAQAALDDALRYSHERVAFQRPIRKFQAIQMHLSTMATELAAARLLVYKAAWALDHGSRATLEAAQAKLFASEMANHVADLASRIHGANGFAMELPLQRYLRDARFLLIGGGTSEILHSVIARELP